MVAKIIYSPTHRRHDPAGEFVGDGLYPYSEAPARADAILHALQQGGYSEILSPRTYPATHLQAVHELNYLNYLEKIYPAWRAAGRPQTGIIPDTFALRTLHTCPTQLLKQSGYYCFDAQTPIVEHTYAAAIEAAHCALSGADLLCEGHASAYALCRPPGHHAGRSLYGGYSYLNNAAIAANYLNRKARVALLDFDYHHGNGSQDIFYNSDQILFISIHADPNRAYPFYCGYADERGAGAGRGFNHNFPLPPQIDDALYLQVLEKALGIVQNFAPDYLVVSAGTDIFADDPLGDFDVSLEGFKAIGRQLSTLDLPTLLVQEGGYNTQQLGQAILNLLDSFSP